MNILDNITYNYDENGQYTMFFKGYNGTSQKRNAVYSNAVYINMIKNQISIHVNEHINDYFHKFENGNYLTIGYYDFKVLMRQYIKLNNYDVNSCFDDNLINKVYYSYRQKWDAVTQNLHFYTISKWEPIFYEKDTKNNHKGDLKDIEITKKYSNLATTLTFLARWGSPNTIEYLNKQIKSKKVDKNRKNFYRQVFNHIEKFGWNRLYELATRKRDRIFTEKFKEPIFFESLTLHGRCRKLKIIEKNKKSSVVDAWIILSYIKDYDHKKVSIINGERVEEDIFYKSFCYPVKYNQKYHGNIDDYNVNKNNFEYNISFDPVTKEPTFILTKKQPRPYVVLSQEVDEKKLVAFDVNMKRNLLQSSEKNENNEYEAFDLPKNRKDDLITDYLIEVYKTYKLYKEDPNYRIGKKRKRKIKTLARKVLCLERELIANVCKLYAGRGYNHIVLEDLKNTFGKCYIKKSLDKILNPDGKPLSDEEKSELTENVNLAIIIKFLHLSSIKDEFIHIGVKYGIAVSLVQSAYTSLRCPICGHVHKSNRKCQENFKCTRCGYECDADINAAKNIKDRVALTVLRELLLKQNPVDGTFRPNDSLESKEKVKKVLETVQCSDTDVGKLKNCQSILFSDKNCS